MKTKIVGESLTSKTRQRKARLGRCPKCAAWTLRGVENDFAGLIAEADAAYLSWAGEIAAATFEGRLTYALDRDGRLEYRDQGRRAKPSREPLLAEHRCAHPIPATWLATLPPLRKEISECPNF